MPELPHFVQTAIGGADVQERPGIEFGVTQALIDDLQPIEDGLPRLADVSRKRRQVLKALVP